MKELMKIDKEEANRLWEIQFGKKQQAFDFSGRKIIKAAYNDRRSNYGWNIDHVLPSSRGGKTVDYNLICSHILTNDEKADKFPCFKANGKVFEIRKRQNHYEIVARTIRQRETGEKVKNFRNAAYGLKCWKQCKSNSRRVFAGYVKIRVEISDKSDFLVEEYENFLIKFFNKKSIFVEENRNNYLNCYVLYCGQRSQVYIFTVMVGEIPKKQDIENFLNDCITLNTYSDYFTNKVGFKSIQIVCGMKDYNSFWDMSLHCKKDILEKQVQFVDSLVVDELVRINTSAKKTLKYDILQREFYPYNFIFTKLRDDLGKHL